MRIKVLVAQAVAGLALCGLFAPGASAEGARGITFCGGMSPAEEAQLQDPTLTEQQLRELSEAYELNHCASTTVLSSRVDEASAQILDCVEKSAVSPPYAKVEIEGCIAAWHNGANTRSLRERRRKHRKHHAAKGKHRSAQPKAKVALAP